jgi:ABC-type transporter MlaC component
MCTVAAGAVDLLAGAADQALDATQVAVDVGVEQLEEQRVQIRMDEAGLRRLYLRED